jgi:hypothetical protein
MKIKCLNNRLGQDQREKLGFQPWQDPNFQLTRGRVYSVLGLTASLNPIAGVVVQILNDGAQCIFVPLCLFDIVDARLSKFWRAKLLDQYTLALWPEEFYSEYFHDDLSSGVTGVVEKFGRVRDAIEAE